MLYFERLLIALLCNCWNIFIDGDYYFDCFKMLTKHTWNPTWLSYIMLLYKMLIHFANISFKSFNMFIEWPYHIPLKIFLHSRFSVKIKLSLYSVSSFFLLLSKFGAPVKIGYAVVIINSKISVPQRKSRLHMCHPFWMKMILRVSYNTCED